MRALLAVVLLLVVAGMAAAAERDYQIPWCLERGGKFEYILPDRTRVDCLTGDYAVEVDWARKWAEAIGQSLYYGASTGRQPGILLITKGPGDKRYLRRLRRTILHYHLPIQLWTTGAKP